MNSTPYAWTQTIVSFGVLFPDIEPLWTEWWQMKTSGHAIATFQYVSALMYENDRNPVFSRWTQDKGGGPPALWESEGHLYDVGWKKENLDFLKSTLSADYLKEKLSLALDRIEIPAVKKIAQGMIDDFEGQRTRLELRIEQLPDLLTDVSRTEGFTI